MSTRGPENGTIQTAEPDLYSAAGAWEVLGTFSDIPTSISCLVLVAGATLTADGPEGLKAFMEYAKVNLSEFRVEFKRVLVDGDFVAVHSHARANPGDRGSAMMDIFCLQNGKEVEHWDVIQAIPETAMHWNGMFRAGSRATSGTGSRQP